MDVLLKVTLLCKLMFSDDEDDFHDAVTDPDYAQFSVSCPPPKHKRSGSSVSGCRLVLIYLNFLTCTVPIMIIELSGAKLSLCQIVE